SRVRAQEPGDGGRPGRARRFRHRQHFPPPVTPPEDDTLAPPSRDEGRLPEPEFDPFAEGDELSRSLLDDAEALIADGKTYLEAELEFQKTRAAYVADRAKAAAVYGVVAVLLAFLALIGLVVGLIIALTPLLTAWG